MRRAWPDCPNKNVFSDRLNRESAFHKSELHILCVTACSSAKNGRVPAADSHGFPTGSQL